MPDRRPVSILLAFLFILSLIYGCASPAVGQSKQAAPTPVQTLVSQQAAATPLPMPEETAVSLVSPTPVQPRLWVNPALPQKFREQLSLPAAVEISAERASANLWLEPAATQAASLHSAWVYALAAPFPTLTDDVRQQGVQSAWKGSSGSQPLFMTSETRDALEGLWGPAGSQGVQIVDPPASLLDAAWAQPNAWAVVPFDDLEPRWKVLRIEGQSPLDKTFDPGSYPLTLSIQLGGMKEALRAMPAGLALPTNRDPEKLTVLVMTGVTALSRHIGERMEAQGITYPAEDIGGWLSAADLTHISNEVSFYQDCPKPGPERADMRFCSSPKYIKLLEAVGTDIVELTGNHILDWGTQPFLDTLKMYQQRGWKTYGGGANLEDAKTTDSGAQRQPAGLFRLQPVRPRAGMGDHRPVRFRAVRPVQTGTADPRSARGGLPAYRHLSGRRNRHLPSARCPGHARFSPHGAGRCRHCQRQPIARAADDDLCRKRCRYRLCALRPGQPVL